MDDNADAKKIMLVPPPADWIRQPGRPRIKWLSTVKQDLKGPYAPQSSRFGSELPSVEDDDDVWRYTILELHARNDDDDARGHLGRSAAPIFISGHPPYLLN